MSDDGFAGLADSLPNLLRLARLLDWGQRQRAASSLREHLHDHRALQQLSHLLKDSNVAVVEAAAGGLITTGPSGLSEVLKVMYESTDNIGYHLRDLLVALWFDGVPIPDWCRQLLMERPTEESVRLGATELLEQLPPGER